MRLANALFRGGHLSERELVEVCMTGDRPVHIERCDLCADRAVELGRWLDDVRMVSIADADAAFPAERLAVQQAQIMRRLEQLDQPARVIAFPSHTKQAEHLMSGRRVSPAWVGIAAAAGLVLGVVGSQVSARLTAKPAAVVAAPAVATPTAATATAQLDHSRAAAALAQIDDEQLEHPQVGALQAVNELTPRTVSGGVILASYPGR